MDKFAPFNLTPEEIIAFTPNWEGERTPDGRPFVADSVIDRLRKVSPTIAWGVLMEKGFRYQHESGWQRINADKVLCGRAMTAMFLPMRPDLKEEIGKRAEASGQVGDITSWPIYALQEGDVYVADVWGKIEWGGVIGDNLSTALYARTHNGVVQNCSVRDIDGIERIGFPGFIRGTSPTYGNPQLLMAGINCPVRVGAVTVIPGDVILGKRDSILVIPPHHAEYVATSCEMIALRDEFGKMRLAQKVYLPGQIDRAWEPAIEADFCDWLDTCPEKWPVSKERMKEFMQGRVW